LREIEPSAIREVFVETPNITWNDVGGLEEIKKRLIEAVEWRSSMLHSLREPKSGLPKAFS